MATETIKTSATIPTHPERIYSAWMDAREHALFTGGVATIDPRVGGKFTVWDGYIQGENLVLEPGKRIVQAWRSTDFPKSASYSRLEVSLEKNAGGTKVTLVHSEIPSGQGAEYKKGWIDYYFTPMKTYFDDGSARAKKSAKAKAAKKSAATKTKKAASSIRKAASPKKRAAAKSKTRSSKK